MVHELNREALAELVEEIERLDNDTKSLYSHAVQVLTPIDMLQEVDKMVEAKRGLTRPIVFRRALRLYLRILGETGQIDTKAKTKRRVT
jgi:hypothetical protein